MHTTYAVRMCLVCTPDATKLNGGLEGMSKPTIRDKQLQHKIDVFLSRKKKQISMRESVLRKNQAIIADQNDSLPFLNH
jgi:hypothetical protein